MYDLILIFLFVSTTTTDTSFGNINSTQVVDFINQRIFRPSTRKPVMPDKFVLKIEGQDLSPLIDPLAVGTSSDVYPDRIFPIPLEAPACSGDPHKSLKDSVIADCDFHNPFLTSQWRHQDILTFLPCREIPPQGTSL